MRPPPSCLHLLRVVPAQVGDSDRAARLAVLLSRKASDGIDNDQIMSCTGCQQQRPDRPKLLPPRSLTDEVTATCLDLLLRAVPAQVNNSDPSLAWLMTPSAAASRRIGVSGAAAVGERG
ncbi:uncharacterized protein LOC127762074 [Oryza glaberrima]|uniref:Uncharacterized protein n=2 Tax=Oryza TaxID=4527 RepID=A0A0D3F315_9ORYZ|nr:uncharacterized protein LOC127762074 [Oryza glaberrima]